MKKYLIIPLLAIAATVIGSSIQPPKSIATDPNGGQVRISVTDNGNGSYTLNTIGTGTDLIQLQKSVATDQNGGYVRLTGTKNNDGTFSLSTVSTLMQLKPSATPSPAVEGMVFSSTDHHLMYYNGTVWKQADN